MAVTGLGRVVAFWTVMLLACSAVAALQEPQTADSLNLDTVVGDERLAQRLPGLAAVIVRSDGAPRVFVSGERRVGTGDLICIDGWCRASAAAAPRWDGQ